MHPFSLTNEEVKQVSGGDAGATGGAVVSSVFVETGGMPPEPPYTSMLVGEEGGLPPSEF